MKLQNRYILLALLHLNPQLRGSPRTISVKFPVNVNEWPMYQMAYRNTAENFNRPSNVHERYRQSDRR